MSQNSNTLLTRSPAYYKKTKQPDGRDTWARERTQSFHVFTNLVGCLNCPSGILWNLHYTGMMDTGHLRIKSRAPLSYSQKMGVGTESSNLLITWLDPMPTSPHSSMTYRGFPSHLINIKSDAFYCADHLGNSKGFRTCARN